MPICHQVAINLSLVIYYICSSKTTGPVRFILHTAQTWRGKTLSRARMWSKRHFRSELVAQCIITPVECVDYSLKIYSHVQYTGY